MKNGPYANAAPASNGESSDAVGIWIVSFERISCVVPGFVCACALLTMPTFAQQVCHVRYIHYLTKGGQFPFNPSLFLFLNKCMMLQLAVTYFAAHIQCHGCYFDSCTHPNL